MQRNLKADLSAKSFVKFFLLEFNYKNTYINNTAVVDEVLRTGRKHVFVKAILYVFPLESDNNFS